MSGKRFQARAKTVQKLGRDGLVEQNMATGKEKRVSQRTADISFGPARSQEQAAGHRAALRGGDSGSSGKKRRKQPRPVQLFLRQETPETAPARPADGGGSGLCRPGAGQRTGYPCAGCSLHADGGGRAHDGRSYRQRGPAAPANFPETAQEEQS